MKQHRLNQIIKETIQEIKNDSNFPKLSDNKYDELFKLTKIWLTH